MIHSDSHLIKSSDLLVGGRKLIKSGQDDTSQTPLPSETFVASGTAHDSQPSVATFNTENLNATGLEERGVSVEKETEQPGGQRALARSSSNTNLNRLYFPDDQAYQDFLTRIEDSPPIKVEYYDAPSLPSLTQTMVDYACEKAKAGKNPVITIGLGGIETGFTPDQTKQLAEAGVKVQLLRETLDRADKTTGLDALTAAGIPVKFYSPWGDSDRPIHTKSLIVDGKPLEMPRFQDRREEFNFSDAYYPTGQGNTSPWRDVDVEIGEHDFTAYSKFFRDWTKDYPVSDHVHTPVQG